MRPGLCSPISLSVTSQIHVLLSSSLSAVTPAGIYSCIPPLRLATPCMLIPPSPISIPPLFFRLSSSSCNPVRGDLPLPHLLPTKSPTPKSTITIAAALPTAMGTATRKPWGYGAQKKSWADPQKGHLRSLADPVELVAPEYARWGAIGRPVHSKRYIVLKGREAEAAGKKQKGGGGRNRSGLFWLRGHKMGAGEGLFFTSSVLPGEPVHAAHRTGSDKGTWTARSRSSVGSDKAVGGAVRGSERRRDGQEAGVEVSRSAAGLSGNLRHSQHMGASVLPCYCFGVDSLGVVSVLPRVFVAVTREAPGC